MTVVPAEVRAADRGALALPALVAALGAALLLQGAYYGDQLAMVVAVAVPASVFFGRVPSRGVLAGSVGLAVALGVSAAANGFPAAAAKPVATLALAAAATMLAAGVIRRDGAAMLLDALVLLGALVAVIGIAGVAFGIEPWGLRADTWRIASTLTYQNAAGALFAMLLPVAMVRAQPRAGAHRIAVVLLAVGLAGTLSRGAVLAGVCGVAALLALAGVRPAFVAGFAAPVTLAVLALAPATVGMPAAPVLAPLGLLAAAMIAVRPPNRAVTVALAASAAIVIVLLVAATPIAGRISASTNDRARVWSQTVAAIERPVVGTGPGTYELVGPLRGEIVRTEHAHNEYLQALAETGALGLASIVAALALFGRAAFRARPLERRARSMWAAAAAGGLAFAIHSGLDLIWRVPALVAVAFVLLAVMTARHREAP